jgi:pimeloyl-ACP methyl ester carboxylesterase
MTVPATVVMIHGAWHGSWCWGKVVAPLEAANVPTVAVDLPLTSLADDVAVTRAALDEVAGPVVLCGHSYGGVVVTEAGVHPRVRHLVYVCAFAIAEGRSAAAAVDDEVPGTGLEEALRFDDDGRVSMDREGARRAFYLDCAPEEADAALDLLRPTALSCLGGTTTVAAWRTRPSTYAVCTEDRAVHPELQRLLARNCTTTVTWPASHSPFVSRPELVADLLVDLARG